MASPPGTSPTPVWPALSLQDDDVAGEERPVRAAEVEQHAVVARYRDHVHLRDHRRAHRRKHDFTLLEQPASPPADPLASDNCTSQR